MMTWNMWDTLAVCVFGALCIAAGYCAHRSINASFNARDAMYKANVALTMAMLEATMRPTKKDDSGDAQQ